MVFSNIAGKTISDTSNILGDLIVDRWMYTEQANANQSSDRFFYINQCGYDSDKPKRATLSNGVRGETFTLHNATDDVIVFTGEIRNQIADFSAVTATGEYYLKCGDIQSYTFKIEPNRIWNVSAKVALDFMAQSRQDNFLTGTTGYGWRDGHQFSFELNSLVMQYMSNPSYYRSLPYNIYKVDECEYIELQTQNEPDIIWLMKFGVMRYYKWNTVDGIALHGLIKGQIAYFLYLYPYISEFVDAEWYTTIRDWLVGQWGVSECDKSWFDLDGFDNSLYSTQSMIGTGKGQLPPGYAIVPNLMMWEVAKRDNLANPDEFLISAFNNMEWLVNSVSLLTPKNTKGQRMSEYITFHSLTYYYEMYPEICPENTHKVIQQVAKLFLQRSENLWDFRQYQTAGDLSGATETTWVIPSYNEPGNVAGFMAIAYSLARVVKDKNIRNRLKQLAVSHVDNTFGRNPTGRCFDYKAVEDFENAKLGWVSRFVGGYGVLDDVVGVLDGSPKNDNYPYNPDGDTGYTEGWVAYNTAWNMSLAYLCGENAEITDGIGIFAK